MSERIFISETDHIRVEIQASANRAYRRALICYVATLAIGMTLIFSFLEHV